MHGQPRPYRYLSDMPDKARTALVRCHHDTVKVRDVDDHQEIDARTLNLLFTRDLLEKGRDNKLREVYKPTVSGLRLILADEPRLLAAKSQRGYVLPGHELGQVNGAMVGEPEAIDHITQERFTAEAWSEDQSRKSERSIAWECEQAIRAAEAAGVDVTRERLAIQRRIRAIQRKADQRAA